MKRLIAVVLVLVLACGFGLAQQPVAVDLSLTLTTNVNNDAQTLQFGIDCLATNGIDAALGEAELPPFPPLDKFAAVWVGTPVGQNWGNGIVRDYRYGDVAGGSITKIYQILWQPGTGNTIVTVAWNLPAGVTGTLKDPILGNLFPPVSMSGVGSYGVNAAFNGAVLEMVYNTPSVAPTALTGKATEITGISATLNGVVNAVGNATSYQFKYGTTTAYGSLSTLTSAGSAGCAVNVSSPISTLLSNTLYHYKIVATSAGGTTEGVDSTFTTGPPPPTVTPSTTTIADFGDVVIGTNSASKSYTVSGSSLTANIVVTPPAGFQMSLDNSTFNSSVTLTQTGGSVSSVTVYVRFSPSVLGAQGGNVTHASTGATTQNVAVSGTGAAVPVPTIVTSLATLPDFGSVVIGTNSSSKSYTVSGSNLTADIVITAPAGFQVSKDNSTFTGAVTLTQVAGAVPTTTVYARFSPSVLGAQGGNVTHASTGATTQNVAVSGTGTAVPVPTIVTSLATLPDFGSVVIGTNSSSKSYTVSGSNLTADIVITAPAGFQVSKDNSTFTGAVTLTQVAGAVPTTTVYARFSPSVLGAQGGNITHTSTDATTQNVAVSGTGTAVPVPTIVTSLATLPDFGNVVIGSNSSSQFDTVSGSNLKVDIVVTAPAGFQVSLDNSIFGSGVTLTQSGGTVPPTRVYTRFSPSALGAQGGNITHTSTDATTQNVAVSGTGTPVPPPTIVCSVTSLADFGNVVINTNSASKSYTVSGSNLTADIVITAPAGFQVSKDNITFTGTVTLTQTTGAVPTTTVYARFSPTVLGAQGGNISHTSAGATTQNVAVSGTGDPIPPEPTSVLQNPGFESGLPPWVFYTDATGSYTNDVPGPGSPHAAHINIATAGTNVQLYQVGYPLEAGQTYRLTFNAYSSSGHNVAVFIQKHGPDYASYGLDGVLFDLGTSWSSYSVQFTTKNFVGTVTDARLRFWFAPYSASGDQYYIDDVVLAKVVPGTPPTVATGSATGISQTGATLNGTANPNGSATTAYFEYGTTTAYGTKVPSPDAVVGSGNANVALNAAATLLNPNTLYHYRLVATNPSGTTPGADSTFRTLPAPVQPSPIVTTGSATTIGTNGATLNGTVNPNGVVATYYFEYGTTMSYGTKAPVPDGNLAVGSVPVPVSAPITSLNAATIYHYRLVAANAGGTTQGPDSTFTTAAGQPSASLLVNGDFEAGLPPWTFFTLGTGNFDANVPGSGSPHAAHLDLVSPSNVNTQLFQAGITLEGGATYRLSFDAYSSTGHDISVSLHKNLTPYTEYGLSNVFFDLGAGWQSFSVQFTAPTGIGNVNDGRLRFWLAPYAAAGDQYYIDNVILAKFGGGTQPTVVTMSATGVTQSGATLNGTVNPNSQAATYYFEYGPTTAYGTKAPVPDGTLSAGSSAVPVSAPISGLTPNATYHFRLVATSVIGTSQGLDISFKTAVDPSQPVPIVTTGSATAITTIGATLNGTVNPNGVAATYYFEYGTTTAYGAKAPIPDGALASGSVAVPVDAPVSALTSNKLYHYRLVATNTGGTTQGPDSAFTTLPGVPVSSVATNGDFESGSAPWWFYTSGTGSFVVEPPGASGGGNAAHVNIVTIGVDNTQLSQSGIPLDPGATYRLSFKAYSSTGHDLLVWIHKNSAPFNEYGLTAAVFDLGTSWSSFSVDFVTVGFASPVTDARLRFWFSRAANGDQYFIDDVALQKVTGLAKGSLPTAASDPLPIHPELIGNFPNPFNPTTAIDFSLPTPMSMELSVYNPLGQKVRTLVDGFEGAGLHRVEWNGADDNGHAVSSGIYYYRMRAGEKVETRRMVLLK